MKKLFLLLLVAVAAWQAWKHYPDLVRRQPYHEAVVRNRGKQAIERVRLGVGGQSFVRESLAGGEAAVFPFRVTQDATFTLSWQRPGGMGNDETWSGGRVPAGPLMQRHTITVEARGVTYQAERRVVEEKAGR